MPLFASVRAEKIKDLKHLSRIQMHGQRLDESAQKRVDTARTALNLAASDYAADPLDLVQAFKNRKVQAKATEYGKAAIGLHVLAVISPEAIAQYGDPHDPMNPMNQRLFKESKAWAGKEFGTGAIIASRLDVDEEGSGVVDLFIVPVAIRKMNKTRSKTIISVNGALEEIGRRYGTPTRTFTALQTSWAEHARKTIDHRLQRGRPKIETGRDHVHADVIRPMLREASRQIVAASRQQTEKGYADGFLEGDQRGFEAGKKKAEEEIKKSFEIGWKMVEREILIGVVTEAEAVEAGVAWEDSGLPGMLQPVFNEEKMMELRHSGAKKKLVEALRPAWGWASKIYRQAIDLAYKLSQPISEIRNEISRDGFDGP